MNFKKLTYLCMQRLTNFPYIEEDFDALTNYELLSKVVEYLNQVIANNNEQNEVITEYTEAFTELKNYVDNYFADLDVQEEINNKLDKMAQDGSLTLLIKNYVDPLYQGYVEEVNSQVSNIASSVQSQNANISSLTARMDTFASLSEGSTTGDAELIDGRISYTGEVYTDIGHNIRETAEQIVDNVGVRIYNLSTRNANQNYYDYGAVTNGETLRYKIEDYTGTPNAFLIYGKETESSNWATLLNANTIDLINGLKDYHEYTFNRNYYMIRFFMGYSGTGASENVNVMIFNKTDKNINNRVFKLEENSGVIEYLAKDSGLTSYNLSTKNQNANYYDVGSGNQGDTIIYKLESFTGTPNTFIIYARVNEDSNWETLVNLNTDALRQDAKNNFKTYTLTKNYGFIRLFMSYTNTGLNETSIVLYNKLSDNNLLSISLKNKSDISGLQYGFNKNLYKIFRKVVCCGDSYTAGYISAGGQTSQYNENYAWPHFMGTSSGNNYLNCGVTGTTVKTWLTTTYGLSKCQSLGTTQAYTTAWGINDSNPQLDVYLPVGTADDIEYDNDTYYSKYAKVIRELHTISPNAHIFMLTCPDNDTARFGPYNEAVRTIATLYHDTYHTHCIDLTNYRDLFNQLSITSDFIGSHYTAIGYEQFAEIIEKAISDYIENHISEFQTVAFIPFSN